MKGRKACSLWIASFLPFLIYHFNSGAPSRMSHSMLLLRSLNYKNVWERGLVSKNPQKHTVAVADSRFIFSGKINWILLITFSILGERNRKVVTVRSSISIYIPLCSSSLQLASFSTENLQQNGALYLPQVPLATNTQWAPHCAPHTHTHINDNEEQCKVSRM